MSETIKTDCGVFRRDQYGLWHYEYTEVTGHVSDAAKDAIEHRPDGAAWFWFNGSPAPIMVNDDHSISLCTRWERWRNVILSGDRDAILDRLDTIKNPV